MLTKKVFLNAVASFLDYGAKVVVVLITTPLLIKFLGVSLFGVWQMLVRIGDQLMAADGRSTEALRWIIAEKQADQDPHLKRRALGSALVIWGIFLPLFLGIGLVVVWQSPYLTKVNVEHYSVVRVVASLVVLNTMIATLKSFPGGILFGMNLGHKNMGVMAGTVVLGGLLIVAVLYLGYGLAGVALVQSVTLLLGAYISYRVVRKYVSWFGIERPRAAEIWSTLKLSGWFIAWNVVENTLIAMDVVVLGYFTSSASVTKYVVTAYGAQSVIAVMLMAISAAMPGFGGVISLRKYDKAVLLRDEVMIYSWLLGMIIGAATLLCNPSFVRLWVGGSEYAGNYENLMIVLVVLQLMFIRVNAAVINLALDMRGKVTLGAVAAVISIGLSVILVPGLGIIGLCLALLTGRMILTLSYPRIVRTFLKDNRGNWWQRYERIVLTALAVLSVSWWVGQQFVVYSWTGLVGTAAAAVAITCFIGYWVALSQGQRAVLTARLRALSSSGSA